MKFETNPKIRREITESLGEDYDGSVNVHHFVEVLINDIGIKKTARSIYAFIRRIKGSQLLWLPARKAE